MPIELIAAATVVLFIALMLTEVPIAFALMTAGAIGIVLTGNTDMAISAVSAAPYSAIGKYDLLVLPMFILLGAIVANAGIASAIFMSLDRLLGWMPGGLAVATVAACCIFGGISGSSAADVATIGRISVAEMRKHGYDKAFSAALVAASGAVAIVIPPSIPIVLYGIMTGLPIGALLLAGVVPGVFTGLALAVYVVVRTVFFERSVKVAAATADANSRRSAPKTTTDFVGIGYAVILFAVVIGGMYTGLFTSTEAAAVGAVVAFLIAIPMARSRGGGIGGTVMKAVVETAKTSSMIFMLLIGTMVFSYFLAITRLPFQLTEWILASGMSTNAVVLCFLFILILLGMLLDGLSMLLLTVPIAFPVLSGLGVDGVWLGILIVVTMEIGLIFPPVGINVFVICGVVPDLPVEEAFKSVSPFIVVQLVVIAVLFLFPEFSLFLPKLAGLR